VLVSLLYFNLGNILVLLLDLLSLLLKLLDHAFDIAVDLLLLGDLRVFACLSSRLDPRLLSLELVAQDPILLSFVVHALVHVCVALLRIFVFLLPLEGLQFAFVHPFLHCFFPLEKLLVLLLRRLQFSLHLLQFSVKLRAAVSQLCI
jgi:hypothetical protein